MRLYAMRLHAMRLHEIGRIEAHPDLLEVADAAAGAGAAPAIEGRGAGQGALPFLEEKLPGHPAVEMVPGKDFIEFAAAMIEDRVGPRGGKGLLPGGEIEVFPPAVEAAAERASLHNCTPEPPVAPGEHPFQEREGGILPFEFELPLSQLLAQELLFFPNFTDVDLGLPLERGVRLGNEGADGDGDVTPLS